MNLNFETLKILYEDKNLIAIDKPEGLSSISENDLSKVTLHSILESKLGQKIFIVHRLDKEVSGVILFAKNSKTHKLLNNQFNNRSVDKHYTALVHGIINANSGVIDKPIREFGSGRMGVDEKKGKQSVTKFNVINRYDSHTLLDLNPSTGRRHQLRVHLYSIGHPIVGDLRYGEKTVQEKFPRLLLHAKQISFTLETGKKLTISSDLPISFTNLLNETVLG